MADRPSQPPAGSPPGGGREGARDGAREGGRDGRRLVDADAFLSFATSLRALRERVDRASISTEQRRRWQRRLAAISGGGADDLGRATAQLRRLEGEIDRRLPS